MINAQELELYSLIKENYSGPLTLSKFMSITEAEKVEASQKLIDQIYVVMAERYNTIDFGTIPKSLGKIKNMKEYPNLVRSLELLDNIAKQSRQDIPEIAILKEALANIEKFEEKFYIGFMRKNPSIIATYNTLTMAVYCGTSLMIAVLIDFINTINDPVRNTDTVEIVITRKYKRHHSYLMIDCLAKFNEQVKNGNFLKSLELFTRQHTKPLNESISVSFVTVLAIMGLFKLIPIIKELIYIFYYSRMKLSDALKIQAELVEGNIETLKYKGIDENNRTYKIQKWFADKLTKLSNFFAFNYEKAEKKAEIDAKQKLTPDDIVLF